MRALIYKSLMGCLCLLPSLLAAQGFGTWQETGPFGKPQTLTNATKVGGNGLITDVEVHPTNPNIVYIGTSGGMWRSDDQGNNWLGFINQKELDHTISVGNIEVDNFDPNYIYISTGLSGVSRQKHFHGPDQSSDGIYRCQLVGSTKVITKISNGLPNPLNYYPRHYDGFSNANGIREIGYFIHTIEQSPFDANILYAGTSVGLYYTTNARAATPTWQKITAIPDEAVRSIVWTTGSTSSNYKCYVTGDYFAMSTTDFSSWTNLLGTCTDCLNINDSYYLTDLSYGGNPAGSVSRATFHVTNSFKYPNRVYIGMTLVSDNLPYFGGGDETWEAGPLKRYFMSHEGTTWTRIRSALVSGFDPIVSAAYNPSVSSYETITMGSEYLEFIRENGSGYTYTTNTSGYYTNSNPNGHADIQDIAFSQDKLYFYAANDGMLSKFDAFATTLSGTAPWLPIANNNLSAAVSYFVDVDPNNSNTMASGLMHNHLSINYQGTGWKNSTAGGDGLEVCFTKNYGMFYFIQSGGLRKVSFPAFSESSNGANGYGCGAWNFRNLYRDPKEPDNVYFGGFVNLKRIVNGNMTSPVTVTDFTTLGYWNNISAMAISPSDNNYIYCGFTPPWNYGPSAYTHMSYTTNALNASPTWNSISLPAAYSSTQNWLRSITVSSVDPKTVFIAYYDRITDSRPRVYISRDAGTTWADYNNSAANIPGRYKVHCLLYEKGSNDGIYAGTDNGVYYTNRNMSGWIRYDVGLPNVPVSEMVYHPKDNKIIAVTWGRGIWTVTPYCLATGDINITNANVSSNANMPVHANGTITYNANTSTNSPARRFELRATRKIDLTAGLYYIPNGFSYAFDAYITPCNGSSSLKQAYEFNAEYVSSKSADDKETSDESLMKVYPNPLEGDETTLYVGEHINKKLDIKLFDRNGIEVFKTQAETQTREIKLHIGQKPFGIYILKVYEGSKELFVTKVFVSGTTYFEISE